MLKTGMLFLVVLSFSFITVRSQDLLDLFEEEETTDYTFATFKTTRIINGQSIENPPSGELLFIISHRFGTLNSTAYEFFGLDQSTIRFGFEYGVTDKLALGLGRSVYQKTYDGFIKYKILRQSSGKKVMPVSLSWFSGMTVNSLKWRYPDRENYFTSRLAYSQQMLIARKFGSSFSFQLTPTMIHRNLVMTKDEQHDIFAIGAGGRLKLTQRITLNSEYFYLLPGNSADNYNNSFSIGLDIETGGHIFQLHLTNSVGMFEKAFITETTGKWIDRDIHFGFNINRNFNIIKNKKNKPETD